MRDLDQSLRGVSACGYLQTGQRTCHDVSGEAISCQGSGQDAEFKKGIPWPTRRFDITDGVVRDCLTGLIWSQDANSAEYPLTWQEALEYVTDMNRRHAFGYTDWRLPNRRELRSLVSHQTRRPALPEDHPFMNVFPGWYWSSTTAAISSAHAWYVHLDGARMFYGGKDQSYLLWPVRGEGNGTLPITGQTQCYNEAGDSIPCHGTGQDGEFQYGQLWPEPRFEAHEGWITDRLGGLRWSRSASLTAGPVTWGDALSAIDHLNQQTNSMDINWRLPNINELESLVDCSTYQPALPNGHPFNNVQDIYWSSTTSMFEPDWAWALYLDKGAVGVGQKTSACFYVWPVSDLRG